MSQPEIAAKSNRMLGTALSGWSLYDDFLERLLVAKATLPNLYPSVLDRINYTIEEYVVAQRMLVLNDYYDSEWGGIANATPERVAKFSPPVDKLTKLNAVVAFYQLPRLFIHLYSLAWIFDVIGRPGPWDKMDALVEDHFVG